MRPCIDCGQHILMSHKVCPHCVMEKTSTGTRAKTVALGLLLGLGAVGCGETDKDTASKDTAVEEPASEPDMAAEYGVPAVSED